MGRSLSLAAYSALSRRTETRAFSASGRRPEGELVWIHAAEPDSALAIADLAQRLCAARHGLNVLVTVPDTRQLENLRALRSRRKSAVHLSEPPSEHPAAVAAFLAYWRPDLGLWAWGGLRPNLVDQASASACPLVLIDADGEGFDGRRDRWLPEVTRGLLSQFEVVLARSGSAVQRLERLGLDETKLELTAPLQAGGQALPCDDTDISELSAALAGRPVWLATGLQASEVSVVLNAHRHSLRLSHRLLLILLPSKNVTAEVCVDLATAEGFRVRNWANGEEPDDNTQILVASNPEDLGLFYRVAPVSFLGSSLEAGHGGRDPFEAAALGSAVLYGPKVRHYLPYYTRLAAAGAARMVNDGLSLSTAVTQLIAPDQAAAMAHAGWDVISRGAAQTDRILELVQDQLDGTEGED